MDNSDSFDSADKVESDFNETPISPLRLLRLSGKSLLAQSAVYAQLFVIEWAEEKNRLLKLLLATLLSFAFLLCLLLFAGVLALALSWETIYRVPVMTTLIMFYGVGLAIAAWQLKKVLAQGQQSFIAMRQELALDIALIKSKL